MGLLGRSVRRIEDPPLVTGQGRFVADVSLPHQLHMRVVRSAYAHGCLRAIHADEARQMRGVVAVWTADDLGHMPPIDVRLTNIEGLNAYRQPVLASARVRYVGEPVAVVLAQDPYLAEDAAERVVVDVEEWSPIVRAEEPPRQFDAARSTEAAIVNKGYGDVDAAFRSAHAVIALDLRVGRHSAVPIETRGALAYYDAARDVLELHGAAKVPHWNRDQLARMLKRDPLSVHLYEGHVGGGFGVRGELYPEDVLVCAAALRLRRPVKWVEDRREHLIAANHSREQSHCVRAAVDANGHLLAIDDEFYHDQGAYVRTHGVTVADLTAAMLPGPYRLPAYRAIGHVRLTNKTPGGTYRAPGRFESTFVRERLMDAIATRLGIDRIELRRRNLIAPAEMPYARRLDTLGTTVEIDSGDYPRLLDEALTAIDWDSLQTTLTQRRAAGEAVGAGIALFVEKSGLGPFDGVRVTVGATGSVEIVTGAASLGQGVETVIAQICADVLGVDYARVRVVHGRTDRLAFGMGAFASRTTVMTGEATRIAAQKVRELALCAAARLMQSPIEALDIIEGEVRIAGRAGGPSLSLGDIARRLAPGTKEFRGQVGLSAEGWFYCDHMNYPYGAHIAIVSLDRDTGAATVERYLVAYDVGRAVNPMLIEGQIVGGVAQGIGGSLYEEFCYDDRGEPLAVTLVDYLMPTVQQIPAVEVIITEAAPSPLNPLGLKGAGEGGANAVGAAIASAIDDALGRPGAVTQLPATPQRLKQLVKLKV